MDKFVMFCLGWSAGALAIWWWFRYSKLIRSREEWFAARRAEDQKHPKG